MKNKQKWKFTAPTAASGMKRPVCFLILVGWLLSSLSFFSNAAASTVQVEVIHSRDQYPSGSKYPIRLRFKIKEGWYIHGIRSTEQWLLPTSLTFKPPPGIEILDIRFPEPLKKKFKYIPEPTELFSGRILVDLSLQVADDVAPGEQTVQGELFYQACTPETCIEPEKRPVAITLQVVERDAPSRLLNQTLFLAPREGTSLPEKHARGPLDTGRPLDQGLWLALIGLFLGGLALNLTPCVYPLIPITVSYFGGKSGKLAGKPLIHGLLYILGIAVTNATLGVSAALSGGMLGSALQNPWILIVVAGILTVLGLSFFGLWEIRLPTRLTGMASKNLGGLFGTFFMGLTLGIVAAPCLGPFILGLLTYVGQRGDPFLGFLYFFVLSIGMGLPLSILAVFSGLLNRFPLSGDWMVWIKKLFGWILFGMAAYMIGPLMPGAGGGASGIMAALAVAAGIHLGWIDTTTANRPSFVFYKRALGAGLIAAGILFFLSTRFHAGGIQWTPYDKTRFNALLKEKKPVILDFYADWCTPCRAMEQEVFAHPEVLKLSDRIRFVRLDLTRRKPSQEDLLRRYDIKGIPTILFFEPTGDEAKGLRIEAYVDRAVFLEKARQLLKDPGGG